MDTPATKDYGALLKGALKALEEMQARVKVLEAARTEPIAVVGLGCRLPGGGDTPEGFWKLLHEGRDAVTEVPASRFDIDEYYDPDPDAPGKIYTRYGAFIGDVETFDAQFFRISPREAFVLDPQQRLLLETAWEALEHAGISPDALAGSRTGVFAGLSTGDYAQCVSRYLGSSGDAYVGTGNTDSVAAGRLSYLLGLTGPSLAVDTACSSSLVALHLACQSLRSGECDAALAGGVNLILTPAVSINFSKARMLSADGSCKTFDAAANGYVRGEGAGMVVLRRLSDARANGDRILAVIRSTAINQDGRSTGLTVPNGPAQTALIREALSAAGLDAAEVDYIEAHGTGTALGDPIELEALGAVFGKARRGSTPLLVGSVKTNVGHLEAAAGITGVIKTIMALQHEEIPPHLHFQRPTPHVNWRDLQLKVVTEPTPWPKGTRPRRAGVSAFGFSGTNAHAIIEEAPDTRPTPTRSERPRHLLALSAKTAPGLDAMVAAYEAALAADPRADVGEICYTAAVGRSRFDHRLALPVSSREDAVDRLAQLRAGKSVSGAARHQLAGQAGRGVAFFFTGQGAQYPRMGRELYDSEPTFRRVLDRCNTILGAYLERPLLEVLYGEADAELVNQTAYAQPALFAVEYALAQMWQSWGVRPAWAVGHSVGEFVAACLAEVFSLEDGLKLIASRGRLMQALPPGGAMAALGADRSRVQPALAGFESKVSIAAVNSPRQVVISGEKDGVEAVARRLESAGVSAVRLKVSHAFHSALMDPMLASFARVCAEVTFSKPRFTVISTVNGRAVGNEMSSAEYWVNQIRSPVLFTTALETLLKDKARIMLEVGPQPVLIGLAQQGAEVPEGAWLASMRQGRSDWEHVVESLGNLFVRGVNIDFQAFDAGCGRRKVALPTYPFQRQRFWADMGQGAGDGATDPYGEAGIQLGSVGLKRLLTRLAESDEFTAEEKQLMPRLLGALAEGAREPAEAETQEPVDGTLADAFYQVEWEKRPLTAGSAGAGSVRHSDTSAEAGAAVAAARTWILVPDRAGTAVSFARRLQDAGHRVVAAAAGEVPDFRPLLEQAGADDLAGIIDFSYLDAPGLEHATAEGLLASQRVSGGSLLAAVQALIPPEDAARSAEDKGSAPAAAPRATTPGGARIWVVTRSCQAAAGGEALNPAQSTAWGLGKVIALEHPELWGGLVDLGDGGPAELDALAAEIAAGSGEDQVALRGQDRLVPRLKPRAAETGELAIREDGTYLIAGGTGGLGRQVARWLVDRGARHLVLTSRRGASTAAARKAVADLEAAGASVEVATVDVSDAEGMAAVFAKIRSGGFPLRGIVHAAGSTGVKPVARMSADDLLELLDSKVAGGWNLDRCAGDAELDFFLMFSSIASVWGSAGQAHYAAANNFLDALAHHRRARGLRATSINWGPWTGDSMASPEARIWLSRVGIAGLQPKEALRALELCLAADVTQRTVARVDWRQFAAVYQARTRRPFLDVLAAAAAADTSEQPASPELLELHRLPRTEQQKRVLQIVQSEVASALGFSSPSDADVRTGLFDLGMDSLSSVDLHKRLGQRFGRRLPTTAAFDYPTIEKMAAYLCETVLQHEPEPVGGGARPRAASAAWAHEPIAIVGVAARLPGVGGDLARFSELLMAGADLVTEVPAERWDIKAYYDPDPEASGKMYTRYGSFLSDVDKFDPRFFGITPREALNMDPQQRIMLEVCWEALENAGCPPSSLVGSRTGVFIGVTATEYARILAFSVAGSGRDMDPYFVSGNALNGISGRISYVFELNGPSMVIDTACSSSLVSLHTACTSLRNRECDAALAGGVNLTLAPEATLATCRARMLSADGACKTFDASADGYVRGEGAGVLLLKRLEDAQAAGDRILAVIRGSAVNQDGRSSGMTVPNGVAQRSLIRESLANAGLTPADVDLVEAHGSGTALGDPIELEALANVFGNGGNGGNGPARTPPVWVASVKTNIGHLEAAAGIAGVIKVVLSLQEGRIPPQVHFKKPTPHIDWDAAPLRVPTEAIPWERGTRPRVAAVSAFGFSGTNANLVVEEAPLPPEGQATLRRPRHMLALSAKTETALDELIREYHAFLTTRSELDFAEVCYTAGAGRDHFSHRLALHAESTEAARAALVVLTAGQHPAGVARSAPSGAKRQPLAFLFTGQGAQFVGMGRELYDTQPVFRKALDRCGELLAEHLHEPLMSVLFPAAETANGSSLLHQTRYTQPALFAIEYALAQMWMSWGVRPSYALGHSVGEYVAACIAGVFSLEDAVTLIAARGRLMQQLPSGGAMVAVMTDRERVQAATKGLEDSVAIAGINGPRQIVLSGDKAALERVVAALEAQGVKAHWLVVSHAFHSPLMEPMLEEFAQVCGTVTYARPSFPVVSNVTGEVIGEEICTSAYWCRHAREGVQFVAGMQTLVREGARVFLEVGPKPVLIGMAQQFIDDPAVTFLPSLPDPRSGRDDWAQLMASLAELYVRGEQVDFAQLESGYAHRKVGLPTYRFQRQRYWPEGVRALPQGAVAAEASGGHAVLGRRLPLPRSKEVRFETTIRAEQPAFLNDHRLFGTVVVPGSSHIGSMLCAGEAVMGGDPYVIEDVYFPQALVLADDTSVGYQVAALPDERGGFHLQTITYDGAESAEEWKTHATARLRKLDASEAAAPTLEVDPKAFVARAARTIQGSDFYDAFWKLGYTLGPWFRWIDGIWSDEAGREICRLRVPEGNGQPADYVLHPGLIDSCFQALAALGKLMTGPAGGNAILIPFHTARIRVFRRPVGDTVWMYGGLEGDDATHSIGRVVLFDDAGNVVALFEGHESRLISRSVLLASLQEDISQWQYQVAWKQQPSLPPGEEPADEGKAPETAGNWLILADRGGIGSSLARRLRERGGRVVEVAAGESFSAAADGRYEVNPTRPEDFRRLMGEILDEPREKEGERAAGFRAVLHLWSLDAAPTDDVSWEELRRRIRIACGGVMHLLQAWSTRNDARPPQWIMVTRGAQAVDGSVRAIELSGAALWGMGSVFSIEHPELRCVRLDLDPEAAEDDNVSATFTEALAASGDGQVAYRDRARHVARLVRRRGGADGLLEVPPEESYRLQLSEFGVLDNLQLRPSPRRAPQAGEIEIAVHSAGLNFRDVLRALGMLRDYERAIGIMTAADAVFGLECSGRVVAVGEGVDEYAIGDDVVAVTAGSMSSHLTIPVQYVAPKPANITPAEAAATSFTLMTAVRALEMSARLKPGERILIHAASGGVGQAAVALAQRIGAEVFGTASPPKQDFLRELGVTHVLNSRTLEFADQIMELTGGEGVDVVLNSLNEEFIPKSLSVLKPGGRFVEMGAIGIWDPEKVRAYRPDVTYERFDMLDDEVASPGHLGRLLRDAMGRLERAELKPVPSRSFSLPEAAEAFRYVAQAKQIGKVLVSFAGSEKESREEAGIVRPDSSYLVTGGLGGLGREVARWLAGRGAKHLVLAGRSGASGKEAKELVAELAAAGVKVLVCRADVADEGSVRDMLEQVRATMPPLRGVVHAAGVLADGTLLDMSWEQFEHTLAPKAAGAWHLRRLVTEPLDFSVYFSSIASLLGSAAQGNYAAANGFLDGLAHHNLRRGVPGLSINWGPWAEAGMAASLSRKDRARWEASGIRTIPTKQGFEVLSRLLATGGQAGVVPIDWPRMLGNLANVPFFAEVERELGVVGGKRSEFLEQLEAAKPEDRRELLFQHVRAEVAKVLGLGPDEPVPLEVGLFELGLDSLTAVELRNRLQASFGVVLPMTMIFNYPTLKAMIEYFADDVLELPRAQSGGEGQVPRSTTSTEGADSLDGLSTDEMAELLRQRLDAVEKVKA
ncbi:MAG: SDR family NAD(P)-dependent oxidoreductase [Planctomycetota bacterium]